MNTTEQKEYSPEHICTSLDEIEDFYNFFFPHETSFSELKKINPELYCKMKNFELVLRLHNRF